MRRPALAALLGFVLALPAAAQSQFADSAGTYLSVDGPAVGWGGSGVGLVLGTQVEVGRRFGNGLDAGLTGSYVAYGERARFWSVGVTGGLTRPAPAGTVARLQAAAAYGGRAYDSDALAYSQTGASVDLSATLGRSIPVAGSVRVRPTVGVFATAGQPISFAVDRPQFAEDGFRTFVTTGLQVELPVTFRLFGADAAFVPAVRFGLTGGPSPGFGGVPGGGFRLNF